MTADAVGGVWSYALELAGALAAFDIHVTLATMGPRLTSTQRAAALALSNVELVHGDFRLEWMDGAWADIERAGEWLLELEARTRPHMVHLNGYVHGALPWHAPVLVVAHSCVCSWWRAVRGTEAPAEWDRYRAAVTLGLRAASLVVAPSEAMLVSVRADYGPLRDARVIANGRAASRFPARTKGPLIIAVGRLWDEAKNIAALEACAPALPWPVAIAGEHETDGVSARYRVTTRHLGRLDEAELALWLGRASILAHPARYEPFGLVPLEAALAGCALVLGDIASLRELWGDAALFVPPDDRLALRDALTRLAMDATLRWRVAQACHARARELTPEAMARGYAQSYATLRERAMEVACAS